MMQERRSLAIRAKELITKTFSKEPAKNKTRHFGGKLRGFADNRERHFYQRMLRAYLRGDELFRFGFNSDGLPNTYEVQVTYK